MDLVPLIVALFLGVLSGIITGIIPGIHVNLVSVVMISLAPLLLSITSPLVLSIYILSLGITHTFLDAIPSIYLGAPDEGKALSALPGHRLLLQGLGHQAILYTTLGALGSLILGAVLFPFFIYIMDYLAPTVQSIVGYLLIVVVVYMAGREKGRRLKTIAIIFFAGVLGIVVFQIPNLEQPLFHLLSGLFGLSLLVMSVGENTTVPAQLFHAPLTLSRTNSIKAVTSATGVGFIAAFLPGFGSSQAAILATNVVGDIGDEGFLALVGGINTANVLLSIAAVYVLDKARNGAIVTVQSFLGDVSFEVMMIFLGCALVAGAFATLLTLRISRVFAVFISRVNYPLLVKSIIIFIVALSFFFDGILGLVVLATATALGVLASALNVGKNHLLACLIVPVILYFIL